MTKPRNNSLLVFTKAAIKAGSYSSKELAKAGDLLTKESFGGPCCETIDYPFVNVAFGNACATFVSNTPEAPDNDPVFIHYIKFVGQEGQGDFYVNVPFVQIAGPPGTYRVPPSGNLELPGNLSGTYLVVVIIMTSGDYPGVNLLDADGNVLASGFSGNFPSLASAVFDIADLVSFQFDAQCSG